MKLQEILSASDNSLTIKFFNCLLEELQEKNIKQDDIAKMLGYSPSSISNWKDGKGLSLKHLKKVIDKYDITIDSFDEETCAIINFKTGKIVKPSNSIFVPRLFEAKKVWLIYSDLVNEIGIRILKVNGDGTVEYIIRTDNHSDYIGTLKVEAHKKVLVFELTTEIGGTQDLVIFLWLNDMGANATILAGVMIYNRIKDGGGIDAHKILAVPANNENSSPEKISKNEFKKRHPLISEYFKLERPAKFFSTFKIKDETTLQKYIEEKTDKSTSIKLELLEKIQGINSIEDLEKIRKLLTGFK